MERLAIRYKRSDMLNSLSKSKQLKMIYHKYITGQLLDEEDISLVIKIKKIKSAK